MQFCSSRLLLLLLVDPENREEGERERKGHKVFSFSDVLSTPVNFVLTRGGFPACGDVDQNPEAAFWDIDFKLVIKKQQAQKEPLIRLLSCSRDSDGETCSRKGFLACSR